MRARNIKPGFYKNADLLECSVWARLLAPGLWMMADREGRLEDRPKQIKIEIFPCDDVDVNQLLDELAAHQHLTRYEIGGKRFIQIHNFSKHQRPHSNESESEIPEQNQKANKKLSTKIESAFNQGENHFALNDISLTTDSLNPDSAKSDFEKASFDEFWNLYPKTRAGNREKAAAAYRQALKRAEPEQILAGLKSYVDSDEVKRGFAKGATAWLNDDRWACDYTPASTVPAKAYTPMISGAGG